jgi:hypothetical protein
MTWNDEPTLLSKFKPHLARLLQNWYARDHFFNATDPNEDDPNVEFFTKKKFKACPTS